MTSSTPVPSQSAWLPSRRATTRRHGPSTGSSTGTTWTSSWPGSLPTIRERLYPSQLLPERRQRELSQDSGPDRYSPQAQSRASSGEPANLPLGSTESS
jgi:hypothetical protein